MLCFETVKRFCCEDISKIENYQKAIEDNTQTWECHHRLETHNSDGERRSVDLSSSELVALDMYCNRPASELIFLTAKDHKRLHRIGKKHTEEWKRKNSERMKGNNWNKGRKQSEETKRKISEAGKGKKHGPKGKHWKLVDGKRVWY